MKNNLIGHGFVAPSEILPEEYIFGAQKLPDTILVDNGNWRPYLPNGEWQHSRSKFFDTYGCTIYNTLQIIEILERFLYKEKNDYSERFVYIGTETRPPGNNPHVIADWMRKNGIVDEELLPFTEDIASLNDYAHPNPLPDNFVNKGKRWAENNDFGHEWVFTGNKTPQEKQELLKEGLRRSPIGVSVVAWKESGGMYYKEQGESDNHWTDLIQYDGACPIILDSYEPFIKRLAPNYDFGWAKRYHLERKTNERKNSAIIRLLRMYHDCLLS